MKTNATGGIASAKQKVFGVPGGTKVSSDRKPGLARLGLKRKR